MTGFLLGALFALSWGLLGILIFDLFVLLYISHITEGKEND